MDIAWNGFVFVFNSYAGTFHELVSARWFGDTLGAALLTM